MIMNAARDAYAARLCQPFYASRNIDPIAKNIPLLHHDVANVDSDSKMHAAIFVQSIVRLGEVVLDIDCAMDRGQRAGERGKNAVASCPANPSSMARDEIVSDQAKG